MWLPILASLAAALQQDTVPAVHLFDRDDAPRFIGRADTQTHFIAPTSSFSEIVPRVEIVARQAKFRVPAGTETEFIARAVVHGTDEIMALAETEPGRHGPVLIGALRIPRSITARGQDVTGILARRDGHAVGPTASPTDEPPGEGSVPVRWDLELQPEERLCLFPGTGPSSGLEVGRRIGGEALGARAPHALRVPNAVVILGRGAVPGLEIGRRELDAVMIGTPVGLAAPIELTRADAAEPGTLRFDVPESLLALDAGKTFTIVLERPGSSRFVASPALDEVAEASRRAPTGALVDVTSRVGIHFAHLEGPREQLDIRPTMGPGAAWGDLNGDGFLDLVALQGGGRAGGAPLPDRVWVGGEGGSFTDVTAAAGLAAGDAGMGALLVDLDADGNLDLYCANYGADRLFLGRGDGTFEDGTALLPALQMWSASAIAGDPDGDGDLDLYVTSYLDYDETKMPPAEELDRYQREDPVEMLPFAFPGQRNVFLRNELAETGALAFTDVTEALGLLDAQGRGMQAAFWDFDQDGDDDLYIANDVSPNVLFRNEGDGTFKDVSFATGLDDPRGGMGLAIGDVDADGDEDLFLTNWQLEANALYENALISRRGLKRRRASFHDVTVRSGLGPSGIGRTSWGAELFDLELDGDLDLYVANGYTSPDYESTGICVGQTDLLFLGNGRGRFEEANELAPDAMAISLPSRGAAGADHDRDGDIDLLVTANNGRLVLLRNDAERAGTWLGLRLRWTGSLNPYAIGARVEVTDSKGRARGRTLRAGQGYLTGNAPELHFGLGDANGPARVAVTWPDGERTEHEAAPGAWATITRTP